MDSFAIQDLVSELTDLELAILLALICQEHCVIETPIANVDNVAGELALVLSHIAAHEHFQDADSIQICQDKFALSYAVLDCSLATDTDQFSESILVSDAKRSYEPNVNSTYLDFSFDWLLTLSFHSLIPG